MSTTDLSLYQIEAEILNLMLIREALTEDADADPKEIEHDLAVIDGKIQECISSDVRLNKVDGVAYYCREFRARAEAAKEEKKRLALREQLWETRAERFEEYVKNVMLMTGQPRLEGRANTLKLVKNPPSVEIGQSELVPEEYQMVEVRMPLEIWRVLHAYLYDQDIDTGPLSIKPSVSKSKIAEALKRGDGVPGCSLVKDKMRLEVE
jgi:hypothetical protein